MKNEIKTTTILLLCSIIFFSCSEQQGKQNEKAQSALKGDYLGQALPEKTPEFFAPGIVATRFMEHSSPTISPDGNEIYWSAFLGPLQSKAPQVILYVKNINGKWTAPQVAPFSGQYSDGNPRFSPDGSKLFFGSKRPIDESEKPKDFDIWYVEQNNNGWSEPQNIGSPVNTKNGEGTPSVTKDGTLYFVGYLKGYPYSLGIYRSRYSGDGQYSEPELLNETINSKESYEWCTWISPDESYLLLCSERKDSYGRGDLYISYRSENDKWSNLINFGKTINSDNNDRFPSVSPDGKYLFFLSQRNNIGSYYTEPQKLDQLLNRYTQPGNGLSDIYWVSADFIEELKPDEIK